jgi:hypothetical protein
MSTMIDRRILAAAALLTLTGMTAYGQQPAAPELPWKIAVVKAKDQPAPALQAFAFAEHQGKWLLVGGRTNGFHRTSDQESRFPSKYSNEHIYVVDPAHDASWMVGLPKPLRNQLRVTNMEFYQDGNVLYLVGGYGSTCDDDQPTCYQTYPQLTAIRVPEMIQAITAGQAGDLSRFIVSISDERMRVTGGGLAKLGDFFYLVFGQNYHSIYKGAVTGKYTDAVRRFKIKFDGHQLAIQDYQEIGDPQGADLESEFHRRDLNVLSAVRADGTPGITVYGGVFTKTGGPWRHPIYIDSAGTGDPRITVEASLEQRMSLYECAHLLMFDPTAKTMYTTLFGGISFYYYNQQGQLEESNLDNWMPFISSITTLARQAGGATVEVPQAPADSLPGLLGAEGVFVAAAALPRLPGSPEVLDYSRLPQGGKVLLGHLYGGILATAHQSGEFNPTYASSTIYEVYLER